MAYKVAIVWTGSLDDLMDRMGDLGRVVGAAIMVPQKPKVPEIGGRVVGNRVYHLTASEQGVIDILSQSPRVYSYSEIDNQLSQRGYKPGTGSACLSTLVFKGRVTRVSRGMYQLA